MSENTTKKIAYSLQSFLPYVVTHYFNLHKNKHGVQVSYMVVLFNQSCWLVPFSKILQVYLSSPFFEVVALATALTLDDKLVLPQVQRLRYYTQAEFS